MYGTAECQGVDARLVAHHVITYSQIDA